MEFDVIIGNPPYQSMDGGFGASARPVYHLFVEQAMALAPRYIAMIVPSRWFAGGKGLGAFRKRMLGDRRIRRLKVFDDSRECFPEVDLAGGVCYFLWDRDSPGGCEVTDISRGAARASVRDLDEFDVLVTDGRAVSVIRKARSLGEAMMEGMVSGRKPFGLPTNARCGAGGGLLLVRNGSEGPFPRRRVTAGRGIIDKWKVICAKTAYDHAGRPGADGRRKVFSRIRVLAPGAVCTETYIVAGSFATEREAENLRGYMMTRFFRFLVLQSMSSQDITRARFAFVPVQDFSEPWTDVKLYGKYGITEEERRIIEGAIRPMR